MKKIYLQGYYGQNNLGDDYLFYSIIDQFGSFVGDNYEINVDTENILFNEKQYQNIIRNYNNVKLKVTFTNGKIGKIKRILSVIKSNYYIIGGGGYFLVKILKILKFII